MSDSADAANLKMDTSIVVATCSRAGMLRVALESLLREAEAFGRGVEIVVVDDGSTDETPQLLAEVQRTAGVPVQVLTGTGDGVAAARNVGSFAARGEWIASFDDDQIALPGWLAGLRAVAEETGAAVVGGALTLKLPEGVSGADLGPRLRGVLGEHRAGKSVQEYAAGMLPATNNVLIRRDVFAEMGGYDAAFTEGAEDKDFFDRVRAAGYGIWFAPGAEALHVMTAARLSRGNLRWTSLRLGANDARMYCRGGRLWLPLRCAVVRMGVALVRDRPVWLWANVRGSRSGVGDALCSLWYTAGMLRALPGLMRGRETGFLRSLNFRGRNGER